MSYYQRPMGDYKTYGYGGDPGFLSGLWRGIKRVARVALPVIAPWTAPILAATAPKPRAAAMQFGPGGMPTSFPGLGVTPGTLPAFAGRAGPRFAGQPLAALPAPGAACPSGFHPAKDGSGRCVRNRRMNVANPRALRRSMRRVQGFEKMAKRTIQFTRRVRMKKRKAPC